LGELKAVRRHGSGAVISGINLGQHLHQRRGRCGWSCGYGLAERRRCKSVGPGPGPSDTAGVQDHDRTSEHFGTDADDTVTLQRYSVAAGHGCPGPGLPAGPTARPRARRLGRSRNASGFVTDRIILRLAIFKLPGLDRLGDWLHRYRDRGLPSHVASFSKTQDCGSSRRRYGIAYASNL
jgi:hypothetical protein